MLLGPWRSSQGEEEFLHLPGVANVLVGLSIVATVIGLQPHNGGEVLGVLHDEKLGSWGLFLVFRKLSEYTGSRIEEPLLARSNLTDGRWFWEGYI